jgi:hypothetical protein
MRRNIWIALLLLVVLTPAAQTTAENHPPPKPEDFSVTAAWRWNGSTWTPEAQVSGDYRAGATEARVLKLQVCPPEGGVCLNYEDTFYAGLSDVERFPQPPQVGVGWSIGGTMRMTNGVEITLIPSQWQVPPDRTMLPRFTSLSLKKAQLRDVSKQGRPLDTTWYLDVSGIVSRPMGYTGITNVAVDCYDGRYESTFDPVVNVINTFEVQGCLANWKQASVALNGELRIPRGTRYNYDVVDVVTTQVVLPTEQEAYELRITPYPARPGEVVTVTPMKGGQPFNPASEGMRIEWSDGFAGGLARTFNGPAWPKVSLVQDRQDGSRVWVYETWVVVREPIPDPVCTYMPPSSYLPKVECIWPKASMYDQTDPAQKGVNVETITNRQSQIIGNGHPFEPDGRFVLSTYMGEGVVIHYRVSGYGKPEYMPENTPYQRFRGAPLIWAVAGECRVSAAQAVCKRIPEGDTRERWNFLPPEELVYLPLTGR